MWVPLSKKPGEKVFSIQREVESTGLEVLVLEELRDVGPGAT